LFAVLPAPFLFRTSARLQQSFFHALTQIHPAPDATLRSSLAFSIPRLSLLLMQAGGVTAVVGIAVTAMWAAENVSFGAPKDKVAKRERGRKGDGKKKAKGDKPKTLAPQDVPSQHAAATPAVPPPAPKPAAPPPQPVPPQPAKEEGKKKGKKGGKGVQAEAEAAPAPEVMKPAATPAAAPAGKGKKGKQAAAPAPPAGEPKNGQKKAEKDKKKQDKAADLQADLEDGWCQVGKVRATQGSTGAATGGECVCVRARARRGWKVCGGLSVAWVQWRDEGKAKRKNMGGHGRSRA